MNQDITRKLYIRTFHMSPAEQSLPLQTITPLSLIFITNIVCINFIYYLFESSLLDNQSFVNHIVWLNQ